MEDTEIKLARVEQRSKSNTHQIEEIKEEIKEIKEENANYLYYIMDNVEKESLKQACSLLVENLSSEESKEKALLMNEIKTKSLATDTDLQAILDNYKVKEMQEMTIKQLKESIEILKRKEKKGVN